MSENETFEHEDEGILRKIQKLIDKAYGNTTDAEQAALLAKADELMLRYSIDALRLMDPLRPNTAPRVHNSQPVVRVMRVEFQGGDYYTNAAMVTLFRHVARHLFVRIGNITWKEAKVVGYPADLEILEMFFTKLKLHLVASLVPRPTHGKPWQESMANMKNAGYRWQDIHYRLSEAALPDYPYTGQVWERRFGVKFTAEMKKLADKGVIMERNTSSNLENWRYDFINAYVTRLGQRLTEVRSATIGDNPNLPALLKDKKSEVDEAYWNEFPNERPHAPDCQCDQCHGICHDPACKREQCKRAAKERMKPVRYRKVQTRAYNGSAYRAGASAANSADLGTGGALKS